MTNFEKPQSQEQEPQKVRVYDSNGEGPFEVLVEGTRLNLDGKPILIADEGNSIVKLYDFIDGKWVRQVE